MNNYKNLLNTLQINSGNNLYNNMKFLQVSSNTKKQKKCKKKQILKTKFQQLYKFPNQITTLYKIEDLSSPDQAKLNIISNFFDQYCQFFEFNRDGNSLFRILGIEHLNYLRKKQRELQEFYNFINHESFQITVLKNNSKQNQKLFSKKKLIESHKLFNHSITKELEKNQKFYEIAINLIKKYQCFDYCLIVLYRLYIYYKGFQNQKLITQLQDLLTGVQQQDLLSCGKQVNSLILKVAADSLGCQINFYNIQELQVDYIHYNLQNQQLSKFGLSILFHKKKYSLLLKNNNNKGIPIINQIYFTPIEQKKQSDEYTPKQSPNHPFLCMVQKYKQDMESKSEVIEESYIFQHDSHIQISASHFKDFSLISKTICETIHPQSNLQNSIAQIKIEGISQIKTPIKKPEIISIQVQNKSPQNSRRRAGSIYRKNHNNQKNYYQSILEIKHQQNQLYECFYKSMSENNRKEIVIQNLKLKFEQMYNLQKNTKQHRIGKGSIFLQSSIFENQRSKYSK